MKFYFLLLGVICTLSLSSQNLVPNGDFETYTECPLSLSNIDQAAPWTNLAAITPDYYHQCALSAQAGTPNNSFGFQIPHSGEGYAGIVTYQKTSEINVREYISIALSQPLEKDRVYHVSFHVNLANEADYAVKTLGAHFSTSDTLQRSGFLVLAEPQVEYSGDILRDTADWVTVAGSFTADGGEKYLTIGSFQNDENCELTMVVDQITTGFSYYYIDDVIVQSITTSTNGFDEEPLSIFPNPFSDQLQIISGDNQVYEITIYDSNALPVVRTSFDGSVEMNTSKLPSGIYYYEILLDHGQRKTGTLIKK